MPVEDLGPVPCLPAQVAGHAPRRHHEVAGGTTTADRANGEEEDHQPQGGTHDSSEFDWSRTTALPVILQGLYREEPLYLDLRWTSTSKDRALEDDRFNDAVVSLAAGIRGVSRAALTDEHSRYNRRRKRVVRSNIAALLLLVLVSTFTAALALRQVARTRDFQLFAVARSRPNPEKLVLLREVAGTPDGWTQAVVDAGSELPFLQSEITTPWPIMRASFSTDGSRIVTVFGDNVGNRGALRIWNLDGSPASPILLHDNWVKEAVWSRDGSRLVATTESNAAYLWSAELLPEVETVAKQDSAAARPLPHDKAWVVLAAFSPDGTRLVTGSTDGTARIWTRDGVPLGPPLKSPFALTGVAFDPTGSKVITLTADEPTVWNVDGTRAAHLHVRSPTAMAFDRAGSRVVLGSADGSVTVWSVDGSNSFSQVARHEGPITAVMFSPDDSLILTGSKDGTARVWDLNGVAASPILRHDGPVTAATWSPRGDQILTASEDKTARLWRPDGSAISPPLVHDRAVVTAVFSADGAHVLTTADDDRARIWSVNGSSLSRILADGAKVSATAFSPDGIKVVIGSGDGIARIWRLDGSATSPPLRHTAGVRAVSFSPDGSRVITAAGNEGRIWNLDGTPASPPLVHGEKVESVMFGPQQATVVTLSSFVARVWHLDGSPASPPLRQAAGPIGVAFSADGSKVLALYRGAERAPIWNLRDGPIVGSDGSAVPSVPCRFMSDGLSVTTTAANGEKLTWGLDGSLALSDGLRTLSPDRATFVVTNLKTVEIWRVNGAHPLVKWQQREEVHGAKFSADGSRVLTISSGGVRVWNLDGSAASPWLKHAGYAYDNLSLSPDGTKVITALPDGTARIWNLNLRDALWAATGFCLPAGERVRLLNESEGDARSNEGVCRKRVRK